MEHISKHLDQNFPGPSSGIKNPPSSEGKLWDEVELTPEEEWEAISQARRTKWVIAEERRQKMESDASYRRDSRPWSSEELRQYILGVRLNDLDLVGKFMCDKFAGPVFELLLKYFSGGQGGKLSLEKGIMICGPVGCGKTTMMQLFQINRHRCFIMRTASRLASEYTEQGGDIIEHYSDPIIADGGPRQFYQSTLGLWIDDVGEEGARKNYGNEVNVVGEIIQRRYSNSDIPKNHTHLTTNLDGDQIEAAYGSRVRSRMREMFNVIEMGGPDRRV